MENYRKIIGALIILFLSTFFIHNVSALELTTEVEATGTTYPITDLYCKYADNTYTTRALNCLNPNSSGSNITRLRPVQKINVTEGNYYRTFLVIKTTTDVPEILYRIDTNNDNWSIVSWNLITEDSIALRGQITGATGQTTTLNFGLGDSRYAKFFEVTLKAKHTGDYYFELGDNNNFFVFSPVATGSSNVYVGISPIEEFRANSPTAQAEEKTEEQSEEGQNNADLADSDNEQASQNVISVIGDIIGAFSTPAGDCTLPGNLGNVDLGNVNLCTGKPPEIAQIINIVGSIIIVYACYKVARNIFRIFIAITAFAQGNGKGNTD